MPVVNNPKEYDVIIVGAGPSGIFCAYELINRSPGLKILMIEKGNEIKNAYVQKERPEYVPTVSLAI